ncbi:hypothetical protein [Ferribacterium limneticum]|uniref:hypothetical protein n=1 Tax=Ferribacterium limneticum TaxID=76259 RepID=UPI001CF89F18|nr:hypothetical protein [Ferribacterium limneticum]UCV26751.1 hypothetical protein KI617_10560 [Ferribacterium limneticum]UCV30668.1 hypothetical protein KI608_10560 [Ferribacterium limneticum]
MTKIEELERLLERLPANFHKTPCKCGHPSCKKFFLNFTGSDGRVDEEEADLVILLRELGWHMVDAIRLLKELMHDGLDTKMRSNQADRAQLLLETLGES